MIQLENGYMRIASEFIDQFAMINLSGAEWQIIFVVIRKTYGWQKKHDRIPLSQFEKHTGMNRSAVCRTIKKLVSKQILLRHNFCYSINKKLNQWVVSKQPVSKQILSKQILSGSIYSDNLPVSKQIPSIDTLSIDNIQKISRPSFPFSEIWAKYPNKDGKKAAERSFKASVLTDKDFGDIKTALKNYLASERVKKGYIKNGSTWFNNWRDWIDFKDQNLKEEATNERRERIERLKQPVC